MPTTSVPPLQITANGVVIPLESEILAGVIADMNAAFGGNMNSALNTPQGQLASSMAAIIGDANNQIAAMIDQFNPAFSFGRIQDALGYIYFLDRIPAEPTVLEVACLGAVGVNIGTGAQIIDPSGNVYACTGGALIPTGGTITLQFANLVFGPIAVPTSITISQAIPGWDSATIISGVMGQDAESQSAFELRRQQSVAINATGSLPSIYANVVAVTGVVDVYVTENVTSSTINVGPTSYPLVPHSLYVAVVGGAADDIADAIWIRKSTGSDYNGNQSVTVSDTLGYTFPYPSYVVKFNIPTPTPIRFAVTLAITPGLPGNIDTLVQNAIVNAFAGGDGGSRARIGSTIFSSRFYASVALCAPGVQIISILLGTGAPGSNSVTLGIDQGPTIIAANISVALV